MGRAGAEASVGRAGDDASVERAEAETSVGRADAETSVGSADAGTSVGTTEAETSVGIADVDASVGTADADTSVGRAEAEMPVDAADTETSVRVADNAVLALSGTEVAGADALGRAMEEAFVVEFEPLPVSPPEAPAACIRAMASDSRSQAMLVPCFWTRGRATQVVLPEQDVSDHLPLTHWANLDETHACWPSAMRSQLWNTEES